METPECGRQTRPIRKHTPRLSERKKSLFSAMPSATDDMDDDLLGVTLLESERNDQEVSVEITPRNKRISGGQSANQPKGASMLSLPENEDGRDKEGRSPIRRSPRISQRKLNLSTSPQDGENNGKENVPVGVRRMEEGTTEQLQELFSSSMRLNCQKSSCKSTNESSIERGEDDDRSNAHKRISDVASESGPSESPPKKMPKFEVPAEALPIPTKMFYPKKAAINKGAKSVTMASVHIPVLVSPSAPRSHRRHSSASVSISSRGVRHKIRRPLRPHGGAAMHHSAPDDNIDVILKNLRNEKLRNLIISKREERIQIEKVHDILRKGPNPIEMARPLSTICCTDDSNNNNTSECSKFGNEKCNGSEEADFSDIEYEVDENENDAELSVEEVVEVQDMMDEVIPMITHSSKDSGSLDQESNEQSSTRKFFKSGRKSSTPMEVKITDNIKASVCKGKLTLIQEKKKTRRKLKRSYTGLNDFVNEQATVEAILKNLDDSTFGESAKIPNSAIVRVGDEAQVTDENNDPQIIENDEDADADAEYSVFRNRLPYNTTDPELIEQQKLLLDFLISNNICTEENFKIFITEPENHKEEAARIVDQVVLVINGEMSFRNRIPCNTDDADVIAQQHRFLDFLIENNICTEENFDIFIANYDQRKHEAAAIIEAIESIKCLQNTEKLVEDEVPSVTMSKSAETTNEFESTNMHTNVDVDVASGNADKPESEKLFPVFYPGRCQPLKQISTRCANRRWNGGQGLDQYQIDAGQRNFGAYQCRQCGLVYSLHEPEEEKLHSEFHSSMHILRFKGWIDEDVVAKYAEWGSDGRILRITDSANVKRRERLMDVLKIVDKELGFSSYVMPSTFVAYLAVRKQQIVGLCLVQPLHKANKYICLNGVDCCTKEEFDVKCGISRIWVSPLHRRLRIASKLIRAVQLNTIGGIEIKMDEIAFSAPTENGKAFAKKITQTENFLVYQ